VSSKIFVLLSYKFDFEVRSDTARGHLLVSDSFKMSRYSFCLLLGGSQYRASGSVHPSRPPPVQPADDDLAEAAIDAFANLDTATAVDRGSVSTLTDAHFCVTKQLEEAA
jgi:hypothetical protein